MLVRADFHIHSCVSPCASLEMSPAAIAEKAKEKGLDLVALTDHNTAINCPAFKANCAQQGLWSLYGMEVTSSEEAHLMCLDGDKDGIGRGICHDIAQEVASVSSLDFIIFHLILCLSGITQCF